MKLPASLAPWAKYLQIFPEEISLTLGAYVRKISPFISPLNISDEDESGEPNGYDGVARRGIYERLLISELALADDFSEEFVRRAVMGEHLFLNLAKRAPGARRISVALFDAGALQIGTPRIAHLAAFILLARRAEAAKAAFLWGVLQDAQQLIISDDTEASIKILLESRTARAAAEADVAAWRGKLSEVENMADVWLVGGEQLAGFAGAANFSQLAIEDVLELDRSELALKIRGASGIVQRTSLSLPPPDICTRLLRNPFELPPPVNAAAEALGGRVTSFFFESTGSKLFARLDSHGVLAFPVDNSPNAGRARPTTYRAFHPKTMEPVHYIAAGRLRKAIAVAARVDAQTIRLEYRRHGFGLKPGLYRLHAGEFAFPENEKGLLQIYNVRPQKFHYDEAAMLDAAGNLYLLNQIGQEAAGNSEAIVGTAMLLAKNVLAAANNGNRFVYVGCEDGNEYHRLIETSDKVERRALAGRRLKQAFFGRGEYGGKVLGFEDELGTWTIIDEEYRHRVMPPPKGEVVGVMRDPRIAPSPGFFELMDDRRTLDFSWQPGRRKTVLKADQEIVRIELSPRSPLLAYQTGDGELVFFSLTHGMVIRRYKK